MHRKSENWQKTTKPLPMIAPLRVLERARRQQPLHDQLIRAVRRHGEECAADQPRPHRVRLGSRAGVEVEHAAVLPAARAPRPDRRPAARHEMAEDQRSPQMPPMR